MLELVHLLGPALLANGPAPAVPILRGSVKLNYARVSEPEARLWSRKLLTTSNLGLDGESDVEIISSVTNALVVAGAAGGAIVSQELPGPEILRWTASAMLICSPFAFLSLGLASPKYFQRGVSSARRLVSPAYRARMLRHEAGHFLAGHLVGLPVLAFSVNAAESAVECGPADGEECDPADEEMLHRLAVVSLAGIVAECLCFGKAEGGLADLSQLSMAQGRARSALGADASAQGRTPRACERESSERNLVRWAAVQAYALLHSNGDAFERLVRALEAGLPLDACLVALEDAAAAGPHPQAMQAWAFDGSEWPVERSARIASAQRKSAQHAASDRSGAAEARWRQAWTRLRAFTSREPSLAAGIVAGAAALGLVAEAVANGTPLR